MSASYPKAQHLGDHQRPDTPLFALLLPLGPLDLQASENGCDSSCGESSCGEQKCSEGSCGRTDHS